MTATAAKKGGQLNDYRVYLSGSDVAVLRWLAADHSLRAGHLIDWRDALRALVREAAAKVNEQRGAAVAP